MDSKMGRMWRQLILILVVTLIVHQIALWQGYNQSTEMATLGATLFVSLGLEKVYHYWRNNHGNRNR